MKIIVLKFGGTSVGTTDRIKKVAKIIAKYKKKYNVIVLSSAMSGVTNNLINLSKKISKNFSDSEYDVLVSSGEQMSCALISGELINSDNIMDNGFSVGVHQSLTDSAIDYVICKINDFVSEKTK